MSGNSAPPPTSQYFQEAQIRKLLSYVENTELDLQERISDKRRSSDSHKGYWYPPVPCYDALGRLSILSLALKRGLRKEYPILCDVLEEKGKEIPIVAKSDYDLISMASEVLKRLEAIVVASKKALDDDVV